MVSLTFGLHFYIQNDRLSIVFWLEKLYLSLKLPLISENLTSDPICDPNPTIPRKISARNGFTRRNYQKVKKNQIKTPNILEDRRRKKKVIFFFTCVNPGQGHFKSSCHRNSSFFKICKFNWFGGGGVSMTSAPFP